MSQSTDPAKLLENAIAIVNKRNEQLIEFLQLGKSIKISNAEYMEAYNCVLKTSDAGADPCEVKDKKSQKIDLEDRLYQHYLDLLSKYLIQDLKNLEGKDDDEEFVEAVKEQFKNFKMFLHWMWKVFQYLDRFFLKNQGSSLKIKGFQLYKTNYWEKISDKVFKAIVRFQFDQLRNDCVIPRATIQILIQIYSFIGFNKTFDFKKEQDEKYTLKIPDDKGMYVLSIFDECKEYYEKNFQQQFAQELEKFYKNKVNQWMNLSTPEYVTEVLKALEKEKEIAQYFYPHSKTEMIQIIEQITIIETAKNITQNPSTGAFFMLQNEKEDQLKDIYNLFNHSPKVRETLSHLAAKFQEYLIQHGKSYKTEAEAAKEEKKPQKDIALDYIKKVQSLRKKSQHLLTQVFKDDLVLQSARDKSFQTFLNDYERSTFYLALHSDNLLKSESFNNEQEVEEELQNILNIFVSLFSRDVFFKHYQKFFSNRLLNSTSKNHNAEKDMIAKFKAEAGATAVSKIVTMFQDINQSAEMMKDKFDHLKSVANFDMNVNVLTSGCWPLTQENQNNNEETEKAQTPIILSKAIKEFESIYAKKHQGRNLYWLYSQGTADLIFTGKDEKDKNKKCRYTLAANSYQLLVVIFLDEIASGSLTFGELQKRICIESSELDYNLQPLIKLKILTRSGKDAFKPEDTVTINTSFSNKQRKVKCIPGGKAAQKKTENKNDLEKKLIDEAIERERECVVDACIVRIMKGKRELLHNQLIPECIQMITNFKAEIKLIKRRIESLIDRDYLKRDTNDIQKLIYVP